MSGNHTRAGAHEAEDPAAVRWIDEEIRVRNAEAREAGLHPFTEDDRASSAGDLFTREFVSAAFVAGREQSWLIRVVGGAMGLLTEARSLFREYEAHHRDRMSTAGSDEASHASFVKAERNGDIAGRIEEFMLDPATPRDRFALLSFGLYCALRGLMVESEGVWGLNLTVDPMPWDDLRRGGRFPSWLDVYDDLADELERIDLPGVWFHRGGEAKLEQPYRIGENPAETLRRVAEHLSRATGRAVDHQSFDKAAEELEDDGFMTYQPAPTKGTLHAVRETAEGLPRVPTSREVMRAGGVDPDAPFDIGPFPSRMRRQAPPSVRPVRSGPLADGEAVEALVRLCEDNAESPAPGDSVVRALALPLTTSDPRWNPSSPVLINGYLYRPATKES